MLQPEGPGGATVTLRGAGRFTTFTVWCFVTQGIYFCLASFCTIWAGLGGWPLPGVAAATWVLFEVSLPMALLVTTVSTFVLFPAAERSGSDALAIMRRWPALVMHNLNVVFMVLELLLLGPVSAAIDAPPPLSPHRSIDVCQWH